MPWSLTSEIAGEGGARDGSERDHALLVTLAVDQNRLVVRIDVIDTKAQDLMGAEPAKQHQVHQGEVAIPVESLEECLDLIDAEGFDQFF